MDRRVEADAGVAIKDLCRKHGFSEGSDYLWRSNFGGMSVADAKRLKEPETDRNFSQILRVDYFLRAPSAATRASNARSLGSLASLDK